MHLLWVHLRTYPTIYFTFSTISYVHCVTLDPYTLNNGTNKLEKENKEKDKEVEGTVTPENKTKVKGQCLLFKWSSSLVSEERGGGGVKKKIKFEEDFLSPNILTVKI